MLYDTARQCYTCKDLMLEDIGGVSHLTDDELRKLVVEQVESFIEQEIARITERAQSMEFPRMGYTNTQVFKDADEYIAFKTHQIAEDLMGEVDDIIAALRRRDLYDSDGDDGDWDGDDGDWDGDDGDDETEEIIVINQTPPPCDRDQSDGTSGEAKDDESTTATRYRI